MQKCMHHLHARTHAHAHTHTHNQSPRTAIKYAELNTVSIGYKLYTTLIWLIH